MTRVFREDTVTLDASKISTYIHDVHGPVTVFKDVVIARAIVHEYDDGMAYKPGRELGEAYWTADGMWATSGGHPNTAVISTRDQIHGRTVNVRFTRSLIDPGTRRPRDRGVLADLEVFDNKVSPEMLTDMKNGKKSEVSIGFFFDYDATSGVVDDDEDRSLNGTEYDYVQRNITINHVAFGIDHGRCGMPYCGIGADGTIREVAGDPVGKWETFEECVKAIMAENPDYTREQAEGTCGKIEAQSKEKDFKPTGDYSLSMKTAIEEAKIYLRDVLGKLDAIEFLEPGKDDLVEEEYQGNASSTTLSERAKKFFNISDDDWLALTEEEKTGYIGKLPPEKQVEGETNKDEADAGPRTEAERAQAHFNLSDEDWEALSEEEKQAYIDKLPERGSGGEDDEDCADCDEDESDEDGSDEDNAVEDEKDEVHDSPDEVLERYRRTVKDKDYPY